MWNFFPLDPEKDLDAILGLWNGAMGASFPLDSRLFLQQLRLERCPVLLLGARDSALPDALAGAILAKRACRPDEQGTCPRRGSISFVVVDERCRRRGLATALYTRAMDWICEGEVQGTQEGCGAAGMSDDSGMPGQSGPWRISLGADTWHFFPGIPEEEAFAPARASARAWGFEPGSLEYDLCADLGACRTYERATERDPTLSAFPRIAVIHGQKSALHSPHTHRMGLVHRQFLSRGCLALHENPKSDRLLGSVDIAAHIPRDITTRIPAPADGYRVIQYSTLMKNQVADFFGRCFPGRWKEDVRELLEAGFRPQDLLLLETCAPEQHAGQIVGFALVCSLDSPLYCPGLYWRALLGENPGGLGPIGIDAAHRGKGLGLYLLGRGLAELASRGCRATVIDWTDLEGFYARFGFTPWKRYRMYARKCGG